MLRIHEWLLPQRPAPEQQEGPLLTEANLSLHNEGINEDPNVFSQSSHSPDKIIKKMNLQPPEVRTADCIYCFAIERSCRQ